MRVRRCCIAGIKSDNIRLKTILTDLIEHVNQKFAFVTEIATKIEKITEMLMLVKKQLEFIRNRMKVYYDDIASALFLH